MNTRILLLILALLLAAGSLIACLSLKKVIDRQNETIESQKAGQSEAAESQNARQRELEQTIQDQEKDLRELRELEESREAVLESQEQEIAGLRETIEELNKQPEDPYKGYILYEVKPGDTLGSVCLSLGIDYWKYRSMILEINHIQDENVILSGQTLMFPPYMAGD